MSNDKKSALGTTRSTPPEDESPGVPGFATWRGVYAFVFGMFVLGVVLLTILTRVYA
jgi:hypothetical protein